VRYASYDSPGPVEVADLDKDGRPDVVVAHGGSVKAGVYRGMSNGMLAAEELYTVPAASHYNPHGLAIGDFTDDGWLDVAIANDSRGIVVLRNAGAGTPPPSPSPSASPNPSPSVQPSISPSPSVNPSPTPTPTPAQPPSEPRSLVTSPNLAAGIGLSWQPPTSAGTSPINGYRIYRETTSGAETVVSVGPILSFTDTDVANGATYWYRVAALSASGEGPASGPVVAQRGTPPSTPIGVTIAAGKQVLTLKWSAPASTGGSPITGYRIYRGTTSSGGTFLVSVGAGTATFTDASVTRRTRYYYRITATNVLGEGPMSAQVNAVAK
jgi:hypothetical protein